ncbi:uncharacterized protein A4U43_C02F3030 [Asparagus officinalis]|uniref:DNA-directed RNA polymerase III subunit RPC4 n=1 Tax=Asparagus officinalis TaxID=4686 RepID=A0A5P1FH91_ASPOF|nr:uncharacterized protein LOC109830004 [Asparagus officinalis]XP_020252726.1 uncharacterized protein LOC109830004 [Asparagus officinalis]ONK77093.1 uncharacterized protein A4U43_C02F3030 [Asparagus officinalis]
MRSELDDAPVSAPKLKFAPKVVPRKQTRKAAAKVETVETKSDLINKELLAKLNKAKTESSFARRPKVEKKSAPAQVAFGDGSSSLIRSFGYHRSAVSESGPDVSITPIKEYIEPWDYGHTYYPVTLPFRRPYSGDPEILDSEEFGEDSTNTDNVPPVPPAEELGLTEPSTGPQMFLFQFPAVLPFARPPTAATNSEGSNTKPNNASNKSDNSKEGCTVKDLQSGHIGKMMVYSNGKVKMKIGDTLFDVSSGENFVFAQDAAVINVEGKHCCFMGEVPKRVVVTPDIDHLLEALEDF